MFTQSGSNMLFQSSSVHPHVRSLITIKEMMLGLLRILHLYVHPSHTASPALSDTTTFSLRSTLSRLMHFYYLIILQFH